jgi:hypothetical protein
LIAVGYRLASPNEFFKTYKIGPEQLMIFVVTVIVTVSTDLLVGVGAGIAMKFLFLLLSGVSVKSLFKAHYEAAPVGDEFIIKINESAVFSNLAGFKKAFANIDASKKVVVDFTGAHLLDHTFMEFLHHFEEKCVNQGGSLVSVGFDRFKPFSNHPLAARRVSKDADSRIDIRLSPRQIDLRKLAEGEGYTFYPQKVKNALKYKEFPIESGHKVLYEENLMTCYTSFARVEISDITLGEGVRQAESQTQMTILYLADIDLHLPDFALEPERLWTKLGEFAFGKDIDFSTHEVFSKKYYLRGVDETAVRNFFSEELLQFLEQHDDLHIEAHKNKLIIFVRREELSASEIKSLVAVAQEFLKIVHQAQQQPALR